MSGQVHCCGQHRDHEIIIQTMITNPALGALREYKMKLTGRAPTKSKCYLTFGILLCMHCHFHLMCDLICSYMWFPHRDLYFKSFKYYFKRCSNESQTMCRTSSVSNLYQGMNYEVKYPTTECRLLIGVLIKDMHAYIIIAWLNKPLHEEVKHNHLLF